MCLIKIRDHSNMTTYNVHLLVLLSNQLVIAMVVMAIIASFGCDNCCCMSQELSPPPGNSIAMMAKAMDGREVYNCSRISASSSSSSSSSEQYQWKLVSFSRTATLVHPLNTSLVLGSYKLRLDYDAPHPHPNDHNAGSWTLLNSDGDAAESGHVVSVVAGKIIATSSSSNDLERMVNGNFLALASRHRFDGIASRISYVAQLNLTTSSMVSSACSSISNSNTSSQSLDSYEIVEGSFQAMFYLWKQDMVPPNMGDISSNTPSLFNISELQHQRPVEAFFAQGIVKYLYMNHNRIWVRKRVSAKLFEVPGSYQLGSYYSKWSSSIKSRIANSNNDTRSSSSTNSRNPTIILSSQASCISIDDPNGFQVCGQERFNYSSLLEDSMTNLPWSLMKVTDNIGTMASILGPFTFVQMVSTLGGLPPTSKTMPTNTTQEQVWRSPFIAIFWLYTDRGAR